MALLGCAFLEFKFDFSRIDDLAIGDLVESDDVSTGGHVWRVRCYPRGNIRENTGVFLSLFLGLQGKSRNVKAIFDASLMNREGEPSMIHGHSRRLVQVYPNSGSSCYQGWPQFAKRRDLERLCVTDAGLLTILCGIVVLHDDNIPVPPSDSDIRSHLGALLDRKDKTDVSFDVDGKTFHAHRAVLAARSPVFRAELFGSMAEATMPCITLHDIAPVAFKAMLRFMYTDGLPGDDEIPESPVEVFQHLLALADRYALDRLKLMCAQKLWDNVSIETVATMLACAETYNCPELKNKCFDFFAMDGNFKEAVFTDGFPALVQKFPTVAAELKERVRAKPS